MNNGPITHIYYVSPSVKTDMTLKNKNNDNRYLVEATNENIEIITTYIHTLADSI